MEHIFEDYVYKNEIKELVEKDLYYIFIDIPTFWEIEPAKNRGIIYANNNIKGYVYFKEPIIERNVSRIEWISSKNKVYKIDYYNRFGYVFSSEYLGDLGNKEEKVYFSSEGIEVLHYNYSNGIITLYKNGQVMRNLSSLEEMKDYMAQCNKEK